jgi:hypothetical protein
LNAHLIHSCKVAELISWFLKSALSWLELNLSSRCSARAIISLPSSAKFLLLLLFSWVPGIGGSSNPRLPSGATYPLKVDYACLCGSNSRVYWSDCLLLSYYRKLFLTITDLTLSLIYFEMSIPLDSGARADLSGSLECLSSFSGMKVIFVTSMNSSIGSTSSISWFDSSVGLERL